MPRTAREKSSTGFYHIVLRGANRQVIFYDTRDNVRFLEILQKNAHDVEMKVFGWSLMDNHVHLLVQEGIESISTTLKRITVSYVWYYNQRYGTVGHLFQDRFRSENVETERYLLTVIRYIHQNAVKAGMVSKSDDHTWSSCSGYYGNPVFPKDLLDCSLILAIFSDDKETAKKLFRDFNELENEDSCLDYMSNERLRLTDQEALAIIVQKIEGIQIAQIKSMPKRERDDIIRRIKAIDGITQRQAARIIGVSEGIVFKA